MASKFGNLDGSGPQQIWLSLKYRSYNQAGNYSTWDYEVRYYGNGWGSWTNATQTWRLRGFAVGDYTFTIPYADRNKTYTVLRKASFTKQHDSKGRLSAGTLTASIITNHSSIGSGSVGVPSGTPPRIPKKPAKPSRPVLQSVTPTSISFKIAAPDNGGAPISTYNLQTSRNAAFTSIARSWNSGSTNQVSSPLDPGTQYWTRYRAVNSVGAGPWSDALQATTPASTAPGLTVTPSLTGDRATLVLTPPGGSSQVTSYRVQRRPLGGSTVTYDAPSSPYVVTGLAPGVTNDWRAAAMIGSYQSPWTDWVTVAQPHPNTNPGDYFDGSSPPRGDLTFEWYGTPNNSMSRAIGVSPLGWVALPIDTVMAQRVTGGLFGGYSARVLTSTLQEPGGWALISDETESGYADVAEGGTYVASLYVKPSRDKALILALHFLDNAGENLPGGGSSEEVIAPGGEWTRLTYRATAPSGAAKAALRLADESDPLDSGDSIDVDGAMLSLGQLYDYFDGSTPDDIEYSYAWLGLANRSASQRTNNEIVEVDLLADPDCPPIPTAPQPPRIEDSCIDPVETWRRYWAIISEDQVYEWLAVVPTISLTTADVAERQVRIRFYPNPDGLPPEEASDLEYESEQIISYLPPNSQLTLDGVSRRVWATVGTSEELSAGHLLYGADGGPATWPTLECGSAYLISFDVPLDAPIGNLAVGVSLTTRMM